MKTRVSFAVPAARRVRGDVLFQRVLWWTVPLWLLGALTVAQAWLVIRLVWTAWPKGSAANLVVIAWAGVALTQAFATFLVGIQLGTPWVGLAKIFGFGVFGWIFGALAIGAGAAHQLYGPRVVRATVWLGGMILLLGAVSLAASMAGLPSLRFSPAPLGMLMPHSSVVGFYASVAFFLHEDTLGEKMTRLILFFPWATALSLAGLGIVFTATLERNVVWRLVGFAGGLVGIVFSWSRIGIAALLAAGAVYTFLRAGLLARVALVTAVALGIFMLPLFGIDPVVDLAGARHAADSARAGSSMARDLIYQKSWEGFLQSPLIGHGWIGESVHRIEQLPIGSHSTVYGLLYTGGLPTFTAFAVAMISTLAVLVGRAWQARPGIEQQRIHVAIAMMLCLCAFCPFEELFSLTLPCLFMFTWIGACVGHGAQPEWPPDDPMAADAHQPAPDPYQFATINRALGPPSRRAGRAFTIADQADR